MTIWIIKPLYCFSMIFIELPSLIYTYKRTAKYCCHFHSKKCWDFFFDIYHMFITADMQVKLSKFLCHFCAIQYALFFFVLRDYPLYLPPTPTGSIKKRHFEKPMNLVAIVLALLFFIFIRRCYVVDRRSSALVCPLRSMPIQQRCHLEPISTHSHKINLLYKFLIEMA